jgi:hypothetical protein
LIASGTLLILTLVACSIARCLLHPLKLFATQAVAVILCWRTKQILIRGIATLPLRRRWSLSITDGRRAGINRSRKLLSGLRLDFARMKALVMASPGLFPTIAE